MLCISSTSCVRLNRFVVELLSRASFVVMDLIGPFVSDDIKYIDDISSDSSLELRSIDEVDRIKADSPCCSSADTVFLSLPPLSSEPRHPTIGHQLASTATVDDESSGFDVNDEDDINGMSTPIQSVSNNTSATSTPITNRTKCTDDRCQALSDWSSDDEDTSGYNDKRTALSSTYSSERPRLQSDYFHSSRGAYYEMLCCWTFATRPTYSLYSIRTDRFMSHFYTLDTYTYRHKQ